MTRPAIHNLRLEAGPLFEQLASEHRALAQRLRDASTLADISLLWREFNPWADRALLDIDILLEQEWVIDGHSASEEGADIFRDALESLRDDIACAEQEMVSPPPATDAERALHQIEDLMRYPSKARDVLLHAQFAAATAEFAGKHADAHAWRTVASVAYAARACAWGYNGEEG